MESFPADFVSQVKELTQDVGLWIGAQVSCSAADADAVLKRIDQSRLGMSEKSVLSPSVCFQLRDVALTAAAVSLCTDFGMVGLAEYKEDFAAACEPPPSEIGSHLWRRTRDLFCSAARMACAQHRGDTVRAHQEQRVSGRHARHMAGHRRVGIAKLPPEAHHKFSKEAARVMPSTVVMLSTCLESTASTSAPSPRTPYSGAVEGRCTELLLKSLDELQGRSWMELLWAMRRLVVHGHGRPSERQVPSLSCSRSLDLNTPFSIVNPKPSGRHRALLVGINYVGQEDLQMSVGHKDVAEMQRYLLSQGYSDDDTKVLADDGHHEAPNRKAIERCMSWLVKDAKSGDSLFFLYSGHGCTYTGDDHEEPAVDADEALCPADFRSAGVIFDDEIYRLLVAPLRDGVQLTCVVDCCQSGTVLHLPYAYTACEGSLASTKEAGGDTPSMEPNKHYDPGKMLQVIEHHPAMCAAAAFWAGELTSMDPSHHRPSLGNAMQRVSRAGLSWAAG